MFKGSYPCCNEFLLTMFVDIYIVLLFLDWFPSVVDASS